MGLLKCPQCGDDMSMGASQTIELTVVTDTENTLRPGPVMINLECVGCGHVELYQEDEQDGQEITEDADAGTSEPQPQALIPLRRT